MGQAAEQIIAGVVLSERLAVTMYGAIHRAQFSGQRNLRGLVVDPKILAESAFRIALTDSGAVATAVALAHVNIVPTVAVEEGGPDVVIVTRGVGRYVTVQDLITAARANRSQSGKLSIPVAAAIGKSVVEALAAAHKARVVHGAVHPRSVLIDEDGGVRLGDFIVGRALTTAVAQGADSALWRGLAGYLAPELVVGVDPAPEADVFAVGALLFTMLSGEAPPGTLRVTPAVERLVQRALDTDLSRRYRSASDLLQNLLEAFEDDRWDIADRGEVIAAAGLSHSDTNLDEATEDLLASLGDGPSGVQIAPIRPAIDQRAVAASTHHAPGGGVNRLDALLADLDDGHTAVEDRPFSRDPISELIESPGIAGARSDAQRRGGLIAKHSRRAEVAVHKPRVPSLDDPDDETPLPPPSPTRDSDPELPRRPHSGDEAAAMKALAGLSDHDEPAGHNHNHAAVAPRAVKVAAAAAKAAAAKAVAGQRAAANAAGGQPAAGPPAGQGGDSAPRRVPPGRPPLAEIPQLDDLPPVRLKSRVFGIVALLVAIAAGVAIYVVYQQQEQEAVAHRQHAEEMKQRADEATRRAIQAQADPGAIVVTTTPNDASVWLKLGRTNLDTIVLPSSQVLRLRIEHDGYQPIDTEVAAASWTTDAKGKRASVSVTLKAIPIDGKTKKPALEPLPAQPRNIADQTGFTPGEGPVHVETSPPGAEVWLLIGFPNTGVHFPTIAGRDYELRALAEGYKPGYASITADEWRDPTGDAKAPIDLAKKRPEVEKHIDLEVDPAAPKPSKGK